MSVPALGWMVAEPKSVAPVRYWPSVWLEVPAVVYNEFYKKILP